MKPKKCKVCKEKFEPMRPLQMVCSPKCGYEYAKKQEEKKWKKRKGEIKDSLKTKADYIKELQTVVNKYVRLRDKDRGCISCGTPLKGKYDAGHFFSVGNYPELRFQPDNIHAQCVHCNQYRGGNLHEYRENLLKRIGEDKFKELEELKGKARQYTIPELIELKEIFKEKIRKL